MVEESAMTGPGRALDIVPQPLTLERLLRTLPSGLVGPIVALLGSGSSAFLWLRLGDVSVASVVVKPTQVAWRSQVNMTRLGLFEMSNTKPSSGLERASIGIKSPLVLW